MDKYVSDDLKDSLNAGKTAEGLDLFGSYSVNYDADTTEPNFAYLVEIKHFDLAGKLKLRKGIGIGRTVH